VVNPSKTIASTCNNQLQPSPTPSLTPIQPKRKTENSTKKHIPLHFLLYSASSEMRESHASPPTIPITSQPLSLHHETRVVPYLYREHENFFIPNPVNNRAILSQPISGVCHSFHFVPFGSICGIPRPISS
jgi:hypothetical protein